MPELPEVETTCKGIAPYITGQTVTQVLVRNPQLRWPVPENLAKTLTGQTIQSVTRRAKYLLLATTTGTLIIHLGMSGSLRVLLETQPPGKHDHIDLVFGENLVLRFNDPRRFGAVLWTDQDVSRHPLLKNLGPEPLEAGFTGGHLYALSRKRKVPVKTFIMDSYVVVGVGNIYANEALFMAKLLPTCPVGDISLPEFVKLAESIGIILRHAIQQGGTTLRDFVNEKGKPGYFQQQLRVYGRAGLPCVECGQPLEEIRLSNRSTVFCRFCQHS